MFRIHSHVFKSHMFLYVLINQSIKGIALTSGILSVVFAGVYLSKHKARFSPMVVEFMHDFWELLAHYMNTVLFILSGTYRVQGLIRYMFPIVVSWVRWFNGLMVA